MPFLFPGAPPQQPAPEQAPAPMGRGRVVGKVIDAKSGAPVANVEVLIFETVSRRNLPPVTQRRRRRVHRRGVERA
jgi:hypothetical protein